MLGWSTNLFRVRGIQLAVHFTFFLLLAVNAFVGWAESAWSGLLWNTVVLVAFFVCVVLHELGHSFTAMHFGIGVRRILLMPIGGMAEFERIPREPKRELLITLAGPAVNFVIAALLWRFVPDLDDLDLYSVGGFVAQLFYANLIMGCFNFLPAFPMDGGRIVRALLAVKLNYLRATFVAATFGKIVCVLGAATALFFLPWLGWSDEPLPMVAVLFAFIFVVGEMEYRAVRQREFEDAHWRTVQARLHGLTGELPPRLEEPPLLS